MSISMSITVGHRCQSL